MVTARQLGLTAPLGQVMPTSLALSRWRRQVDADSRHERIACLQCLGAGLAFYAVVTVAILVLFRVVGAAHGPSVHPLRTGLVVATGVCLLTLGVAAVTKPQGRAECARQVWEAGRNQWAHTEHPAAGAAAGVILIVAFYGSYAIVEASRRLWILRRLRGVDPDEIVRILSAVSAAPAGVGWSRLARYGQSPRALCGPVAALVLNGWIELTDNGQTLVQRSPAMRRLTRGHPLAEVFAAAA